MNTSQREQFRKEFWQLYTGRTVGTIGEKIEAFIDRIMAEQKRVPYNLVNHFHCWNQKQPPACGQKIEHAKCCLCGVANTGVIE